MLGKIDYWNQVWPILFHSRNKILAAVMLTSYPWWAVPG